MPSAANFATRVFLYPSLTKNEPSFRMATSVGRLNLRPRSARSARCSRRRPRRLGARSGLSGMAPHPDATSAVKDQHIPVGIDAHASGLAEDLSVW